MQGPWGLTVWFTLISSNMSRRPSSTTFWASYLRYGESGTTHGYTTDQVWRVIGGGIGLQYGPASNSCAARVSRGLNYGGAPIRLFGSASMNLPEHVYEGKAGDGMRYIVSAEQMTFYLRLVWDKPNATLSNDAELVQFVFGLKPGQCAIFATKGHTGVLRSGYSDPYVKGYLPVAAWILP